MKSAVKSSKVNRAWLNDHVNDTYVKLAKKEGYRARAAYKLQEIDETLHLIKPGQLVVDLGSAPGAWSQYVRRRLSPKSATGGGAAAGELNGRIIALDLLPMEAIEGVLFIQGDIREDAVLAQLAEHMQGQKADVVISDMAPNLSGISSADAIPEQLDIDLAGYEMGVSIHISAVTLPKGVAPTITDRDFTIATIAAPAAVVSADNEAKAEGAAEVKAEAKPAGKES